jgi:putative holliday junction resolvase
MLWLEGTPMAMNEFSVSPDHPLHLKSLLALDFGEKFIGVATYCVNRDPYPTPYGRIQNHNDQQVCAELKKILDDELIDIIIIGVPRLLDGKQTKMTLKAQAFIANIVKQFTLPVFEQDETLSTFEAESRMKNSPQYNFQVDLKKIDAVAASVILEDFIRRKRNDSGL